MIEKISWRKVGEILINELRESPDFKVEIIQLANPHLGFEDYHFTEEVYNEFNRRIRVGFREE